MERGGGSEYRRTSQAIWEAVAAGWDERYASLEEVTRPVTSLMLERLEPQEGDTLLELAAGTGVVGFAAALALPTCRVILSDFAPAMVAAARRRGRELGLTNCEYRVIDAERIDLANESVGGVLCRWGYMLMADPAGAVVETRRVLRPGGRLSFAVFAGRERNPWAALPADVLIGRGHMKAPGPGVPGAFALADVERVRRLLGEAGFDEPRIDEVEFHWRFAGEEDYWDFLVRTAGAFAMVLTKLAEAERAAIRAEIAARLAPFAVPDGLSLPATSLVVSAT